MKVLLCLNFLIFMVGLSCSSKKTDKKSVIVNDTIVEQHVNNTIFENKDTVIFLQSLSVSDTTRVFKHIRTVKKAAEVKDIILLSEELGFVNDVQLSEEDLNAFCKDVLRDYNMGNLNYNAYASSFFTKIIPPGETIPSKYSDNGYFALNYCNIEKYNDKLINSAYFLRRLSLLFENFVNKGNLQDDIIFTYVEPYVIGDTCVFKTDLNDAEALWNDFNKALKKGDTITASSYIHFPVIICSNYSCNVKTQCDDLKEFWEYYNGKDFNKIKKIEFIPLGREDNYSRYERNGILYTTPKEYDNKDLDLGGVSLYNCGEIFGYYFREREYSKDDDSINYIRIARIDGKLKLCSFIIHIC